MRNRRRKPSRRCEIDTSRGSIRGFIITALCIALLVFNFYRRPRAFSESNHSGSKDSGDADSVPGDDVDGHRRSTRKHLDARFDASRTVGTRVNIPANFSFSGFVKLSNGVTMPRLGFGTAGLGPKTQQSVEWAIASGYRLVDSAQAREWYREDMVGKAIQSSNVPRDQLFIVSKLHPKHLGRMITKQRFEDSLRDLNTTYLDLFLLHYPYCSPAVCGTEIPAGSWLDSWRAMEDLYELGKVRAIGVSNFFEEELTVLLKSAKFKPHVLQRFSDPFQADFPLQEFCKEHDIQYMGFSSLGTQWQNRGYIVNPVLTSPTLKSIALSRNCSVAQVVLKWAMSHGQVVIPRSSNLERMNQNLHSSECKLESSDITLIDSLDGTIS